MYGRDVGRAPEDAPYLLPPVVSTAAVNVGGGWTLAFMAGVWGGGVGDRRQSAHEDRGARSLDGCAGSAGRLVIDGTEPSLAVSSGTADVVDAHVVVCRRARRTILTSDPDDLRRLDPAGRLVVL